MFVANPGQNPPGQNPPGQNLPKPPRTKSHSDKILSSEKNWKRAKFFCVQVARRVT